ncbi:TPA: hypothetical protein ACGGFM_004973, partial [Escherichia coli]
VNCAGMSAILAVSFPLINFRSNGLCPPSGGFFIRSNHDLPIKQPTSLPDWMPALQFLWN